MTKPSSTFSFPEESARYRTARTRLLRAERDLRRHVERVAAMRRKLPLGGRVAEDYVFEGAGARDNGPARPVKLSELFEADKDTLVIYSYMFGPDVKQPCPMCTSFLDSLDGAAPHLTQRVNVAVVAKSPIERVRALGRERGWRHLRLLSSARNTYNRDYHGETADGGQMPVLNVFVRRRGAIHHFYATELLFAPPDRGEDPRHIDMMWPLWNVLDLTPDGRGKKWYPSLAYRQDS